MVLVLCCFIVILIQNKKRIRRTIWVYSLSLASLKIIDYTHFNGFVLLIASPAEVYSEKMHDHSSYLLKSQAIQSWLFNIKIHHFFSSYFLAVGRFFTRLQILPVFLVVLHRLLGSYVQRKITKGYKKHVSEEKSLVLHH